MRPDTRFLLPTLATLPAEGELPQGSRVPGAASDSWDGEAFRRFAAGRL